MTDITNTTANMSHEIVTNGKATVNVLALDLWRSGAGDTLKSFMVSLVLSRSLLATSATGTAVRAIWVIALALVALAIADRMKPATPKRTIPVRVDNKRTPLYKEPEQQHRRRALAQFSLGALFLGALIASLLGLILTLVFEVVGGLLQA